MITKQAPWEKRNLNVECWEFYLDIHDTKDAFFEIEKCAAEYQVMHIDCGNTEVLFEAQKRGFVMVETNIRLGVSAKDFQLPSIYRRYEPSFSYKLANAEEQCGILHYIGSGEIFTTDKIARDPYFGTKKAGERYALWTKDLLQTKNAKMILPRYKDKVVGFAVQYPETETTTNMFLGGVLPEYAKSGLGFMALYANTIFAISSGASKMVTGVSSNNLPILRLHELFGYKVTNLSYTLFKHI